MIALIKTSVPLSRDVDSSLGPNMRTTRLFAILAILTIAAGVFPSPINAADKDGVAVAIVYDTSGSMKEPVRDGAGKLTPKYVIANRSLVNIADRVEGFMTNSTANGSRTVHAGLFVFEGNGAKQAVAFGPFKAAAFRQWADQFSSPNGGTPLGNAVSAASQVVLQSGLTRKHVLVITDGNNTLGPAPAAIMPPLMKTDLSIHFIAFDVDASVFASVKKLGATVVAAADERQLNSQLDFIMEQKILLEAEEPVKKK
jgi:hypothetical protein